MKARALPTSSWRAAYLLLVSLLLPMGTAVLAVYYFAKLGGSQPVAGEWAYTLIVLGGGLSAAMAVALAVAMHVLVRQRNRFESLYRKQNAYLTNMLDERLRLERNLDVLGAAHQVTLAIKQETSFERIASVVLEQIEDFSRAYEVVVYAAGPGASSGDELEPRARRLRSVNAFGREIIPADLDQDLAYEAMLSNRAKRHYDAAAGEYAFAVPYATPDGVRGVLTIRRKTGDDPDFEGELRFFEASLQQLVKAVSLGLKFSALWDRAIKDEMTGLFNKNHFNDEIGRLLAASLRNGRPLSLIMLDIDKFKHINDTWGHVAGDLVLHQVAGILLEDLRTGDVAFRFGGEELCVICPDTVDRDAALFAERLRSRIAHTEFRTELGELMPLSASIGVAEFDPAAMKDEGALKEACDEALYQAKNSGRNRVVIALGGKRFESIERSGDESGEVKQRMGLAGDNTPLPGAADAERRSDPKSGKIGRHIRRAGEPDGAGAADAAESIRRLAEEIIAATAEGGSRLAEAGELAQAAASTLRESRTLAAAMPGNDAADESVTQASGAGDDRAGVLPAPRSSSGMPVGSPHHENTDIKTAAGKRKVRRPERRTGPKADRRTAAPDAKAPEGQPERRQSERRAPAARRRKPAKKKAAAESPAEEERVAPAGEATAPGKPRESAMLKAIEARAEAEREESSDSDRMDFITDHEADELIEGKAPRKSKRKSKDTRVSRTPRGNDGGNENGASWTPRKHW